MLEMKYARQPAMNAQDIILVKGKPLDNDDLVENGFETSIQVAVPLFFKIDVETPTVYCT